MAAEGSWEIVMRWRFRGPLGDSLPRPWVIVMRWRSRDPFGDSLPRPIAAAAVDAMGAGSQEVSSR